MSAENARVLEILDELRTLYSKKSLDYGMDDDPFFNLRSATDWGMPAWVGALLRANDKMRRLQRVARGGVLANESIEDSFRDLAIYAIAGLVLWEGARDRSLAGKFIPVDDPGKVSMEDLRRKLQRESQGHWHQ